MLSPLLRASLAALLVALAAGGAEAESDRYIPRPPVILSPDLTEPWVLEFRPGYRAALSERPLRERMREDRRARRRIEDHRPLRERMEERRLRTAAIVKPARPNREIDPEFLPQIVDYDGTERPGTIVIDTSARFLYLVREDGTAIRYGVGVGREGFSWSGAETISRKAEWPAWVPPAEMRKRQPELPVRMEGGPNNPLGARALYLGSTLYRIHGSNEPWTIGQNVSSGCIRMRNEDVTDLYERVKVGAKVKVM